MEFSISKYGNAAALISFENEIRIDIHHQVRFLYESLRRFPEAGIKAITPAYNSILVYYEPRVQNIEGLSQLSQEILSHFDISELPLFEVEIPVCYDEEFGLDHSFVQEHTGFNREQIIEKHTDSRYLVYMLGFVPGFLYLGGMDPCLNTPRLKVPRSKIPKGAVGIADNQTGVYPLETPGGWQVIGNCPLDLGGNGKVVVEMGDYIKFKSISLEEHHALKNTFPKRIQVR